jgi:hypothetical protein
MTETTVHLEDVTRAARQGLALTIAVTGLGLSAMLAAGVSLVAALLVAAILLAAGSASGGFGLVARIAFGHSGPRRRPATGSAHAVEPLRGFGSAARSSPRFARRTQTR